MSTKSREFWEDYLQRNGSIDVPTLLDAYAAAQVADKDTEIRYLKSTNATNAINLDHLDAEIELLMEEKLRLIAGFREIWNEERITLDELKALLSPSNSEPIEAPSQKILCPKCNSHRTERLGVGINAGTIYGCWDCKNEWENEL